VRYTRLTDNRAGPGLPITYCARTGVTIPFTPLVRRVPALLTWLTRPLGPYPFPTAGLSSSTPTGHGDPADCPYGDKIRGCGQADMDDA